MPIKPAVAMPRRWKTLLHVALAWISSQVAIGEEVPRQGEYLENVKWWRYSYAIETDNPYVKALPGPEAIPKLIELAASKRKLAASEVAKTQLECLTRVSFETKDRDFDAKRWKVWWKEVGQDYFKRLDADGTRDVDAWKKLVGVAAIPLPEYKILLPKEWRFEIKFRTGDYASKQKETLTMERTPKGATLRRSFQTATHAPLQSETWVNFTEKEADQFLHALAYAIDQPWLVKRFIRPGNEIPGRNWNRYYPGVTWSGVIVPTGQVWWNENPRHWRGAAGLDYAQTSMPDLDLVYSFACFHYPETARSIEGSSGWRKE